MRETLFRPEVLDQLQARRYGSVLLQRPLAFAVLTTVFVAVAIGIVVFLATASYTRKAHVPGVVVPSEGVVRVHAPQSGIITERRVHEGQAVRRGEVLFVLDGGRSSATHGDAGKAVSSLLQSRLDSLRIDEQQQRRQAAGRDATLRRKAAALQGDLDRIAQQSDLQLRRVALAQAAVDRLKDLSDANFISPAQLQDRMAELLDQRQRLGDLQRAASVAQGEQAAVQAELRDLPLQVERDLQVIRRNLAAIEQEVAGHEAQRQPLVTAPRDGIVAAIAADAGQDVGPERSLAIVLPAQGLLEAELYAPSRAAGFIRPGMSVNLRYQAYPYQKFGQARGMVREVAAVAMRGDDLPFGGPAAAAEPLYRVRVRLERQDVPAYGEARSLKAGMALEASVLLEPRRLIEWILEPLYSVGGRV